MGSTLFESWVSQLRLSWMGEKARRIFGGFAAALGDATVDWATQGLVEQLPSASSDPAVLLTANDRRLDADPREDTADIAARAPYWLQINKFRGRGIGLLLGLHFAGFKGAVVVQQNGRALSLSLPLPEFGPDWDPTPSLVVTQLGQNPTVVAKPTREIGVTVSTGGALGTMKIDVTVSGSTVATAEASTADEAWTYDVPGTSSALSFHAGSYVLDSTYLFKRDGTVVLGGGAIDTVRAMNAPWWLFDDRDDLCNRFAVLFPDPSADTDSPFRTWGVATFDGSSDRASVVWNNPFPDTTYKIQIGAVYSSSPIVANADTSTKSETGVEVVATGAFTGTVEVFAWQDGANPYADLHPADLQRLRETIQKWKPSRAKPMGAFVLLVGRFMGWPKRKFGDATRTFGPTESASFLTP